MIGIIAHINYTGRFSRVFSSLIYKSTPTTWHINGTELDKFNPNEGRENDKFLRVEYPLKHFQKTTCAFSLAKPRHLIEK